MNEQEFRLAKVGDRVRAAPGTFLDAIGTITETGTGNENSYGYDRRGLRYLVVRLPSGNEVVTWDDPKHRLEWNLIYEEPLGNGIEACGTCGGIEPNEAGQCVRCG